MGSVWVSVRDFGSLDGHFTVIVEAPWVYKGRFQKTLIFPTDFNDFIKISSWFGVDSGLVWGLFLAYERDFGSTVKSLWGNFGHIDVEWHV